MTSQSHRYFLLSTVDKQPGALDRLELLLTSIGNLATEDELGAELPVDGDVPVLLGLAVDEGVVVLEAGAKILSLEGGPESVLVHSGSVLAPVAEVVGIDGEGLAEGLNGLGVLEEEGLTSIVSMG